MARRPAIAVIGSGDGPPALRKLAFDIGRRIAKRGAVLVCGGMGGVMEAAAHGARSAGGDTIGILPGYDRDAANRYIEFPIATGMGEARNAIVIGSAQAVIALAGKGGTLAEIGFALKLKRPIVALGAWNEIPGLHRASDAESAVAAALWLAASEKHGR
jgi:uncharacterized protein (TIGR00725 family)